MDVASERRLGNEFKPQLRADADERRGSLRRRAADGFLTRIPAMRRRDRVDDGVDFHTGKNTGSRFLVDRTGRRRAGCAGWSGAAARPPEGAQSVESSS